MRKRHIAANAYTYMGVLKALSHMRDGLSAVQVIGEMRSKGIMPDERHYCMAMFACVAANQCSLAESVFASYARLGGAKPDTALYTLYLRALLQQGKWDEGAALFQRMIGGQEHAGVSHLTVSYMAQYCVLAERYPEALDSLRLLLNPPASTRLKRLPLSVQTYEALSFALGQYSSSTQRLQRTNQFHEARLGATNKLGAQDLVGMTVDGEGGERLAGASNSFYTAERVLVTPSPAALSFLVTCIEEVAAADQFVQVRTGLRDLALSFYLAFFSLST
jgi:pentatricopeptide repeat protein